MSEIVLKNVTKNYGNVQGVSDITITLKPGITGILGPNGAGKSTTMRILAGFLSATEGAARVAGHDLATDSEAIRRRVGFMPENNPLQDDMRVRQ